MYLLGLAIIIFVGPLSGGPFWLFGFAILAGVLLGWQAACFAIFTNALTLSIIGFLMINGIWGQSFVFFNSSKAMYIAGSNFLFLNAILAISVSVLVKGLTQNHEKQLNLSKSLQKEHIKLLTAKNKLEKEILERQQAVTALRESKKKYQNILENIEDGYFEIETLLPDTDIIILADQVQIYQVLLNLCTNASQAMEETGGSLTITVQQVSLKESDVQLYPDLSAGDHLKIMIKDTGPGIPGNIIDKIFDPYFTTKEVGKGSGLGLAIVHGIVQSHKGAIFLESQINKGTNITLFFPVTKEQSEIETKPSNQMLPGTESILFVDDEAIIVDVSQKMLEHLGYTVKTSLNPEAALNLFQTNPDAFDLIITDMTMPQMTGAELSEKILKIQPDIPIIICTGHSSLMDETRAQDMGIAAFVMKPVEMKEIAVIIRNVLDKK